MKSRITINFESVTKGNYTIMDKNKIAESAARISKNLKKLKLKRRKK